MKPLSTKPLAFTDYWRQNTERLIEKFEERANEYDARDLEMVGHGIATCHNQKNQTVNQKELTGILFYIQGKVARALTCMFKTREPKSDTTDDMFIYSMMASYKVYLIERENALLELGLSEDETNTRIGY